MKKKYIKPTLTIEHFELTENIAAGCSAIVDFDLDACYDLEGTGTGTGTVPQDPTVGGLDALFYPESCDCYHSAASSTPSASY
ncbi:MAG TPA: hypothetical protein PLT66_03980 [Bacillota bacterium]|nr:hypothetical protein [Bacillota bacterium]